MRIGLFVKTHLTKRSLDHTMFLCDGSAFIEGRIWAQNRCSRMLRVPLGQHLRRRKYNWHMAIQATNGFFAERLRLNFDPEEFLQLPVGAPPTLEERVKIVDVLSTCDEEIPLLQKQLDALKEQKRGLM